MNQRCRGIYAVFAAALANGCGQGALSTDVSKPLNVQLGYSKDAVLVIVHADDIGMHPDQTDGAFDAMRAGMCRTGSIMPVGPDFARAARVCATDPSIDIGLHFTLNSEWKDAYPWPPLLGRDTVPSLYGPNGAMWPDMKTLAAHMTVEEAKLELDAQIRKCIDAGLNLTHIDAHMGSYFLHPELFEYAIDRAKHYNLPIATWEHPHREELRKNGFVLPDTATCIYYLNGEKDDPDKRRREYHALLENLKPGVHEIVVHAARVTPELARFIEKPYIRSGDYDVWTSDETKHLAASLGITFIGFRELQTLQGKSFGNEL